MKIGSSRNINKGEFDKSTLFKSPAAIHNQRMLVEQYNDKKLANLLLIVQTRLVAYHFW